MSHVITKTATNWTISKVSSGDAVCGGPFNFSSAFLSGEDKVVITIASSTVPFCFNIFALNGLTGVTASDRLKDLLENFLCS